MRSFVLLLGLLLAFVVERGVLNARADPVVRRATVAMPHWPAGARPVRVVLLSDIHIGNLATGPRRLARIVAQVEALRPDAVLFAGDYVAGYGKRGADEARRLVAPLAGLHAPLGVYAVLGNHDHKTAPRQVTAALAQAGVAVLANRIVRTGPLAIGGWDPWIDRQADHTAMVRQLESEPAAPVLLVHYPELAKFVSSNLVLAGHTHCGQVVLPWLGRVASRSRFGPRYDCGPSLLGPQRLVVTAGIGTSRLPIRFGAPPDLWLLTLGPGATPGP